MAELTISKYCNFFADIALIRLPKEFQQASWINIDTIEMNMLHPINYYEGKVLTFSGWGNTEQFKFEFPEKLHAADLQIVKTDASWDGKSLSPERVLQAKQDGGKGACRGDSGGKEEICYTKRQPTPINHQTRYMLI